MQHLHSHRVTIIITDSNHQATRSFSLFFLFNLPQPQKPLFRSFSFRTRSLNSSDIKPTIHRVFQRRFRAFGLTVPFQPWWRTTQFRSSDFPGSNSRVSCWLWLSLALAICAIQGYFQSQSSQKFATGTPKKERVLQPSWRCCKRWRRSLLEQFLVERYQWAAVRGECLSEEGKALRDILLSDFLSEENSAPSLCQILWNFPVINRRKIKKFKRIQENFSQSNQIFQEILPHPKRKESRTTRARKIPGKTTAFYGVAVSSDD